MSLVSDNSIAVVDIFAQIVTNTKDTGTINTWTPGATNDVFTINAGHKLAVGDIITINYTMISTPGTIYAIEREVIVRTSATVFETLKLFSKPVTETPTIYTAKCPYFMHGHYLEIANTLNEKSTGTGLLAYQKFPAIILIQDFKETRDSIKYYSHLTDLTVIIATASRPEWKAADRYTYTFKPVLYPLVERFLQALELSGYFDIGMWLKHTRTDRLFWGTPSTYGTKEFIFNESVDCVQLDFPDLKVSKRVVSGCLDNSLSSKFI